MACELAMLKLPPSYFFGEGFALPCEVATQEGSVEQLGDERQGVKPFDFLVELIVSANPLNILNE